MDFFFCDFVKDKVYATSSVSDLKILKTRIKEAISSITEEILGNIWLTFIFVGKWSICVCLSGCIRVTAKSVSFHEIWWNFMCKCRTVSLITILNSSDQKAYAGNSTVCLVMSFSQLQR